MDDYRLLIIEDDIKIAELVRQVAQELSFNIRTVHDPQDVSNVLDMFSPHIIVLDILMPGMDGFEVLQLLHMRNSASRVLILSGEDTYRAMACRMGEGFSLMVDGAVAKPFRISELRMALQEIKALLPADDRPSNVAMA